MCLDRQLVEEHAVQCLDDPAFQVLERCHQCRLLVGQAEAVDPLTFLCLDRCSHFYPQGSTSFLPRLLGGSAYSACRRSDGRQPHITAVTCHLSDYRSRNLMGKAERSGRARM